MLGQPVASVPANDRLDRRIWLIAGVRAVSTMGLSLVLAFVGIYLVKHRGLSATEYSSIYLLTNLAQAITHGYAGELSDRFGRRPIMAWALGLRGVVMAALGLLVMASAPVWSIAATLLVSASLRGGFEPVAYAVVGDLVPAAQRVHAFGIQRMGTNLGWAIGPALGGLLAHHLSYGAVFFCSAPILIVTAIAVSRMREPARTSDVPIKISVRDAVTDAMARPSFAMILGCALLFSFVHVQLFTTMPIYAAADLALSESDVGLVYLINGLVVLALQVPAVKLIGRIGSSAALIVGALLYVVAFFGIGAAIGVSSLAAAVALLTAGEILVAPAQHDVVAAEADPARIGRAFGVLGMVQMLGVAGGPVIGGILYDHLRGHGLAMWGAMAVLPALLVIGYAVAVRPPGGSRSAKRLE